MDRQTLLFEYPRASPDSYLRPVVKIELGARSDTEPTETPEIRPYLADLDETILGPSTFTVKTVAPERTFWEKAMLLHEERHRSGGVAPKSRLSRHYYDLFRLLGAGVGAKAAADLPLFERIAAHRTVYFSKAKEAQSTLKPGTLQLLPAAGVEAEWRRDYAAMSEVMFFGRPPTFDEILSKVAAFERSFNGRMETET